MLGNTALYAVKKRKKPVQKIPKPSPPDGVKSNPSKRHRDRLNGELDKLTGLLPFTEEVRARLDKLSVLRLSVGYLKVKNFFNATIKKGKNGTSWTSERNLMFGGNPLTPSSNSSVTSPSSNQVTSIDGVSFSEGDLLLQALNGFVLVVTAEGYVFYTSPTIQDFLGFHQSDVVHQSVFELIHTDDRALFRRQLHFALNTHKNQHDGGTESPSEQSSSEVNSNLMTYDPQVIPPENSSFLERNFCCRFRCLLDNSSGFLALNFRGRLKFLHGQNRLSEDGTLVPPQLALFAIAMPLQPPSILEIRTKTLIFQTKHKLDFTPMGIDARGKVVLGYSEAELCTRGTGYHFIHAADMMYCADNHLRMMKTGDSGFTVFRLLAKTGSWIWVQASARLVFKGGKPDFIVARQRALTNEEGEEQLRLRRLQLPFNFATGEALLYDLAPTVDVPDSCSAPKQRKIDSFSVSRDSILGCMLSQDQSIYCEHNNANALNSLNDAAFKDTHATVNVPGDIWQNSSPKPVVGSLVKSEATVQDMMETLQQILEENDLANALDVEPEELKSWETTLLKMSSNNCEVSEDLNDILSQDILSYVEEQLQKEGGLKLLDNLDDVPACLSTLDLQNQGPDQGVEQNFGWPLEPPNQLIPNGGPMMAGQQIPVPGTMKLTHADLPQLNSTGLNGPTLQQIASQQTLTPSVGLHADLGTTGNLGAPMTFNPSFSDSCAQTQNQLRTLQVTAKDNNHGVFSLRQTPIQTNQLHSNQMQNHQLRTPNLPIGLQDQSASIQLNPVFNFQGNQWNASVPNSNQADTFETYTQNISNAPGFTADPSPSSCLQNHFALQKQNSENQRQSWPLEQQQQQQQQQQLISNGHQQMGACINQMSGFQRNPLPGVAATQNAVNCTPMFRTAETSNVQFPVQQGIEPPPMAPPSSCMFRNAAPPVPVNGVHLSQAPSCQRLNPASNQISSKSSCFYQGLPGGGAVPGMTAIPNPDTAQLSCQMTPGLDPDSLLVQPQQYLNFSEQTQINSRPVVGNGGFHFSSLSNGNAYYSENK
ncbi:aryl hydrocarbon receptor 2 [Thunnus maccoyii]|uniref:aryl hydrocarbon receptor 2 n=1 Tax=Thunnus maccoyii TaxID=8240 RepID=UPI001C4D9FB4|nr:aryl hydrocarbon receptor 2 [Thunnus maccoyii]XP_042260379.1 aryl hydrocarbon receptor 2 [Thunnus maccoyii]